MSAGSGGDFYCVGVGASAGGLEALREFFSAMPANTGMAFVVIQHLSPDHKSLMDELLARYTAMTIQVASSGMEVKPNHIYLLPPKNNMSIYQNQLLLEEKKPQKGPNLPIDLFFRSLAVDKTNRAVGVILSGTGSDGTRGIKAIKEHGGMIMVQDQESAAFDGMPRSSISTGLADYILPPPKMALELLHFVDGVATPTQKADVKEAFSPGQGVLGQAAQILRGYCGIDFSFYKETTISRRIERRLKVKRLDNPGDYIAFLRESDQEKETLYRELLIGVTGFFRDTAAFHELREKILPKLNYNQKSLRVWTAGCSTGEEAYSIAILLHDYVWRHSLDCSIKVFATDIDRHALDAASRANYSESAAADIEPDYLNRYFTKKDNTYVVNDEIRSMVVFAKHNVLTDPPFSKIDLLTCRNLLIYIKPEFQQKVLAAFYYSLNPAGYLMIGTSESLGSIGEGFTEIGRKSKLFQFKKGYKSSYQLGLDVGRPGVGSSETAALERMYHWPVKSEKLLAAALQAALPPSIIIDSNGTIVQVINELPGLLRIRPGRFSANLNDNIDQNLALFAHNVLRRLKGGHDYAEVKSISRGGDSPPLTIEGRTISLQDSKYFLLSFRQQVTGKAEPAPAAATDGSGVNVEMAALERELKTSQENLFAAVEELETSNEELQSSNEELIASNEELQSANEELQSVNEELHTVNAEHQTKIEELVMLTNDLNNLIKNTGVAAIYLDKRLCIRKTTPLVSEITNIRNSDIGRPITHIAVSQYYPDLLDDINRVVESLQDVEQEINDNRGRTWLARLRPFRTEHNAVDGIILTFIEISRLVQEQRRTAAGAEKMQKLLEVGRISWWEWDRPAKSVQFDDNKKAMLGYGENEFPRSSSQLLQLVHPADRNGIKQVLSACAEEAVPDLQIHYRMKRKDGAYSLFFGRGRVNRSDEHGRPLAATGLVIEVPLWLQECLADEDAAEASSRA